MLLHAANPAARPNSSLRASWRTSICAEECGIGGTLPSFIESICDRPLTAVWAGLRGLVATGDLCSLGEPSASYPVLCSESRFGPVRRPSAGSLFCFGFAALRVTVSSFAGPSANAELRPWEAGPLAWLRLV